MDRKDSCFDGFRPLKITNKFQGLICPRTDSIPSVQSRCGAAQLHESATARYLVSANKAPSSESPKYMSVVWLCTLARLVLSDLALFKLPNAWTVRMPKSQCCIGNAGEEHLTKMPAIWLSWHFFQASSSDECSFLRNYSWLQVALGRLSVAKSGQRFWRREPGCKLLNGWRSSNRSATFLDTGEVALQEKTQILRHTFRKPSRPQAFLRHGLKLVQSLQLDSFAQATKQSGVWSWTCATQNSETQNESEIHSSFWHPFGHGAVRVANSTCLIPE